MKISENAFSEHMSEDGYRNLILTTRTPDDLFKLSEAAKNFAEIRTLSRPFYQTETFYKYFGVASAVFFSTVGLIYSGGGSLISTLTKTNSDLIEEYNLLQGNLSEAQKRQENLESRANQREKEIAEATANLEKKKIEVIRERVPGLRLVACSRGLSEMFNRITDSYRMKDKAQDTQPIMLDLFLLNSGGVAYNIFTKSSPGKSSEWRTGNGEWKLNGETYVVSLRARGPISEFNFVASDIEAFAERAASLTSPDRKLRVLSKEGMQFRNDTCDW